MNGSEGKVFQILNGSALDGPGLRQVIFLSGCNLRCPFCHNIDAVLGEGTSYTPEQLFAVTKRQLPYMQGGGVTLSGGEPFLQPQFATAFFKLCRASGVHTAIQTNGTLFDADLAAVTDLIIADVKNQFLPAPVENLKRFRDMGCEVWLTSVLINGVNDTQTKINEMKALQREVGASTLKFLPLRRLCLEKYQSLGLSFPYTEEDEPVNVPPPVVLN